MQTVVGATGFHHPTARAVPLKRARFWLVCLFFLGWVVVITGRLFWLQVVEHAVFLDRAAKQQLHTFEVAPRRGMLYDRNLRELAMTVQADSIYADPSAIADKAGAAKALAAIVHTDPDDAQTSEEQIAARLAKGNNFAWVARRVTPEVAAGVKALPIKGIYFEKEFQRFYPNNDLAAQTLGFVGTEDTGLGGLEKKFEPELHGTPGEKYTAMDARRRVLGSNEDHAAGPGQNLVLTIDENIQFMAERALDHAMERTHALNGTVVVQDVHTGEILALAMRPAFNPNMARRTDKELLKNHAVSDAYEPGSVFKLMTYSAALEEKVAKPDDPIDCLGGQIKIGGRVIHDDVGEHYHVIPVHEALEHSSDVAAVTLAVKVGPDKFYEYMRSFGFGSKSGVELPGETRGLLRPVKAIGKVKGWSASSIGSLAIGQEIGVTPLQMVSMVSTIANGGVYLPPHVLMAGQFDQGANGQKQGTNGQKTALAPEPMPFKLDESLPNPLPQGAHRVISELTAAQMRKMMEGVVLYGTGKEAQLNGYSSGGKTGTAQKFDNDKRVYSKTAHIASFAGIAPVNNPEIAVAVIIDSPQGEQHGAIVSAPVFSEVAQQVLEYLGVPHDIEVRAARPGDKKPKAVTEDDGGQNEGDINALYEALNDLPSDDPLRGGDAAQVQDGAQLTNPAQVSEAKIATARPGGAVAKITASIAAQSQPQMNAAGSQPDAGGHLVTVTEALLIRVPSLVGLPIRKVIEQAGAVGLEVNIHGNGTAREQAPAAGTMVAAGTQVVVRAGP
jgi:cell division protein FtsI (penicillin-binding protein 3)